MSVESSSARRRQQNDLSDLQSEYAQKKKKYSKEQEQQIDELKDYYNERKEATREQGEASINHIRNRQNENLSNLKETHHKIAERSETQLADLDNDYRKKVAETQRRRQTQLAAARENTKNKLNEIETHQQQKVESVRAQANEELHSVKEKFNKELHQTQDFTQRRLTQIKEGNQASVAGELERGRAVQDRLREDLKKDYDHVSEAGEKRIADRKEFRETQYNRQEADYEKRFTKQQEQWDHREKGLNEQFQNRINHRKKAYENQLKDQHQRFESVYGKTGAANRESLNIQKTNFIKEQVELKKKFFRESEKYAGKEDDPFYKLQERGNRLLENPDFYIIEAYVPAHEKDNIKVSIKDHTATISGKRAFKDQIEEEGRKLSTSSFQTFREDFSFDKPVITQGLTRERDGDYVTFWVPKLSSFEGPIIPKLNKKA